MPSARFGHVKTEKYIPTEAMKGILTVLKCLCHLSCPHKSLKQSTAAVMQYFVNNKCDASIINVLTSWN